MYEYEPFQRIYYLRKHIRYLRALLLLTLLTSLTAIGTSTSHSSVFTYVHPRHLRTCTVTYASPGIVATYLRPPSLYILTLYLPLLNLETPYLRVYSTNSIYSNPTYSNSPYTLLLEHLTPLPPYYY
jgi:hypothetical protein